MLTIILCDNFVKVNAAWTIRDGKLIKTSTWNEEGRVFTKESQVKTTIKKLTETSVANLHETGYPEFKKEDLLVEDVQ